MSRTRVLLAFSLTLIVFLGSLNVSADSAVDSDGDGVYDWNDDFPDDPTKTRDFDGDGIADFLIVRRDNDGFENGSFDADWTTYGWTNFGNANWTVSNVSAINGNFSAKAGDMLYVGNSWLSLNATNMIADTDTDGDGNYDKATFSFSLNFTTNSLYNMIVFCIDTEHCTRTSGFTQRWGGGINFTSDFTYLVNPGSHVFYFVYYRDGLNGPATVILDDVSFSIQPYIVNLDTDDDNDGVDDQEDAFPYNSTEWLDTDRDGIGNNADPDDDNDGYPDEYDAWPLDPCAWADFDQDGSPNEVEPDCWTDLIEDEDIDGDGIPNDSDSHPQNPAEWNDFDGDGIGDNEDRDDDGDGVEDTIDAFPNHPTEWEDTDGDRVGNNADQDDDGDGFLDTEDAFPLDLNEWLDTDRDGIGNNEDTDDDGDGVLDSEDAFPLDSSEWSDVNGDGLGDNAHPLNIIEIIRYYPLTIILFSIPLVVIGGVFYRIRQLSSVRDSP